MKLINADELIKSLNSRIETRTETMNQANDPNGHERNEAVIMAYQGIIKQIESMEDQSSCTN